MGKSYGARRELRLALSRVRAALTHLRHAQSVNYLPAELRPKVRTDRRDLYLVEESICRRLGALRVDGKGKGA